MHRRVMAYVYRFSLVTLSSLIFLSGCGFTSFLKSIILSSHPMPVEVSKAWVNRINDRRVRVSASGKNPVLHDAVVDCAWITLQPQKASDPSSDTLPIKAVWEGSGGSVMGLWTWDSYVDVDLPPGIKKISIVGKNAQPLVRSVNGVPDLIPRGLRISRMNVEHVPRRYSGKNRFRIEVELTDNRGFVHYPYLNRLRREDDSYVQLLEIGSLGNGEWPNQPVTSIDLDLPPSVKQICVVGSVRLPDIAPITKSLPNPVCDEPQGFEY